MSMARPREGLSFNRIDPSCCMGEKLVKTRSCKNLYWPDRYATTIPTASLIGPCMLRSSRACVRIRTYVVLLYVHFHHQHMLPYFKRSRSTPRNRRPRSTRSARRTGGCSCTAPAAPSCSSSAPSSAPAPAPAPPAAWAPRGDGLT